MTEQLFLNRELQWLEFNDRVLFQARDPRNPLLERVRFLQIYHSNLDEFYMKRVGGLKRQHLAMVSTTSIDGLTPQQQLTKIRDKVVATQVEIADLLKNHLIPELSNENIQLITWDDLTETESEWARDFFRDRIFPVLTPMAVDLGHPFPLISNLSISLAVSLRHPQEEELLFARIKIPPAFPAWLELPGSTAEQRRFIAVVDVVIQHLQTLFPRMQIHNVMAFRVTRNVDIQADEEGAEDLLELIEEEVKQRRFAEVVRLEHGPDPDHWLLQFLLEELELESEDVYEFPIHLEYKELGAVVDLNTPHLKFKSWNPVTPPAFSDDSHSIFNVIRSGDQLVHHPYENFSTTVERFIVSAADDPHVIAIKMTLYRTSEQSPIVHALIRAAEAGKQVVCLIEIKARFDEERNIQWAQTMERAGVHVVYGIVGLKTHAKIAVVTRKERDEFRTYAHVGTGNYHPHTARLYTDVGFLTANPDIARDLVEVFHYLTGRSLKSDYKKLLVAPIDLKARFLELIERETENAHQQRPAEIVAKCNSLEDQDIIEALYKASQAGVPVQLIVRGFCCLRPGVPGLSDNIQVISVIGRFLEHSRIFYFRNGHKDELEGDFYIGSADWMTRNLLGRVEVLTPIEERSLREKIWESLQVMLNDKRQSWDMNSTGQYQLRHPNRPEEDIGCHEILMEKAQIRSLIPGLGLQSQASLL